MVTAGRALQGAGPPGSGGLMRWGPVLRFLNFPRRPGREAVFSRKRLPALKRRKIDSVIDGDQSILGVGHHAKFRHIESPFFCLNTHSHRFYFIDH
jgi:hypothetical protein